MIFMLPWLRQPWLEASCFSVVCPSVRPNPGSPEGLGENINLDSRLSRSGFGS